MAAPTNVRVESNSLTTATVRWSYSGSSQISVWRSLTSGSGFAEIARPAVGATSYTDDTLTEGTRYFYKLSDDVGATFSAEVSVVTHTCLPPAGSNDTFSLPRVSHGGGDPAEEFSDEFNNLAERIEAVLGGRLLAPFDCIACPSNGALVLNCAGHCREWLVVADEDINSISLQYCDEGNANIEFIIPPSTTRRIDGWPGGFGFSGDEGFRAPVSGGANGRTIGVGTGKTGGHAKPSNSGSRPGTGRGIGAGGGTGSGGCNCVPSGIGALTIKSCNADNSLNCSSTKSLTLIACGGVGPYTWSNTGSINLSKTSGPTTTITPPANSGSGVGGSAYVKILRWWLFNSTPPPNCTGLFDGVYSFGCNDQAISNCFGGGCMPMGCSSGGSVCPGPRGDLPCSSGVAPWESNTDAGNGCSGTNGDMCDTRTASMISNGCNPCGLQAGSTVTVTDSLGTQTTVILRQ